MMNKNYKAIIFDWDGTLVDTCGLILDAHNHVRTYMGHETWTMDDFLGRASKSAREYYPEVYGERSDEAQRVLYEYVAEHHLNYLKLMDHAEELLIALKNRNIPLGIVSNKRHDFLLKEVSVTKLESYFDVVIGAGYTDEDKPSPEPLLFALSKIDVNLKPSEILYVGDTETDLMCAQNTKCPVAFVQTDKPRPDLVDKYKPDFVWNDLCSFDEAIEGLSFINPIKKAC